ncbi:sensor histidine kinase [Actinomadura barringtoniae]|uniref:histidine kinase n=1 Tax=Actinomadura barringtoniae TaxID=1427535 RepID=A0A939P5V6_9ACTN|nr:ATP-binding protein [Actinomadura barringtoniae]MBO2445901.1 sensor histidine kinase [Actinomadura barringtoniae]
MNSRATIPILTAVAGGVSLTATAAVWASGHFYKEGSSAEGTLTLVEAAVLGTLTLLTVRYPGNSHRSAIAACLAGFAAPSLLLRYGNPDGTLLAAFGAWSFLTALAVVVGLYLRMLDERRDRAVAETRREQRLELARDLHDFVAHDVSEILAQAQAGQIHAEREAATASAGALQIIEQSAQRALESMDRTLRMLHTAPAVALPSLNELPDLVERFGASGNAQVDLDLVPDLDAPREVGATAYRVVVEALTNVRRHAADASRVTISVARVDGRSLEVSVVDDGRGGAKGALGRRGGLGLPGLQERVAILGGSLDAGPVQPRGWRVVAVLPLNGR